MERSEQEVFIDNLFKGTADEKLMEFLLSRIDELPRSEHLVYFTLESEDFDWQHAPLPAATLGIYEDEEDLYGGVIPTSTTTTPTLTTTTTPSLQTDQQSGSKHEDATDTPTTTTTQHAHNKPRREFTDSLLCGLATYVFELEAKKLQDLLKQANATQPAATTQEGSTAVTTSTTTTTTTTTSPTTSTSKTDSQLKSPAIALLQVLQRELLKEAGTCLDPKQNAGTGGTNKDNDLLAQSSSAAASSSTSKEKESGVGGKRKQHATEAAEHALKVKYPCVPNKLLVVNLCFSGPITCN